MSKQKRKGIKKSVRFEVLKRDSFTCQYCGAKAPDVLLEVDHIIPVAEGGTDDVINLITSCRDCNRGKGKRQLTDDSVITKQRKQLDDMNELREQTEMLIQWKHELMNQLERQVDAIQDEMITIGYVDGELTDWARAKVKEWLKQFGYLRVSEAVEISYNTYVVRKNWKEYYAFQKIGGICWNKQHQQEQDNE